MVKETECKFNAKKGESVSKKLGKKKDAEMKPLKRCKSWCIDESGVACGYNSKTRFCTVFKSGFKGVSNQLYFIALELSESALSELICSFLV